MCRGSSTTALMALAGLAMLAIANAAELQHAHSSSKTSNRKLLQLPGSQGLMQGLTGAMMSQAPQMLGNALNPRGNNAASGLTGLLRPQRGSTNNGAGGLGNMAGGLGSMMTPQGMQGAMSAAQRMMGLGRRLQQWGMSSSQMATNNMRAQAATSQRITEAVESGASMGRTQRASNTGSMMSWAAAQNDQRTFDTAERLAYLGK